MFSQALLREQGYHGSYYFKAPKHSLGSQQLYSHPSQPCIPTTEEYPQLMKGFRAQEGQHRPGTTYTGLRPHLWPSKFVSPGLLGCVNQEEISYV